MKIRLLALLLPLGLALGLSAQEDTEIFLKGIDANFVQIDLAHDDAGNTYVLGRASGASTVVKYDSAGLKLSDRTFSEISDPVAMAVSPDGDVYVAGSKNIRRLTGDDLSVDSTNYHISSVGLDDMFFRDIVYVAAKDTVVAGAQNPDSRWPRFVRISDDLSGSGSEEAVTEAGVGGGGGSRVQSMTVDDLGNTYMVGEASAEANGGLEANRGYIAKLSPDGSDHSVKALSNENDALKILYANGWIYVLTIREIGGHDVVVSRMDTGLSTVDKSFRIESGDYPNLRNDGDGNKRKFGLSADADDNLYLTGYMLGGITRFYDGPGDEYRSVSVNSESAYVAKLDRDFNYSWVKTPIQAPIPVMGSHLGLSWDARNTRLWWSGTFYGGSGLSMQEGSDADTRLSLSQESNPQGFVSVFEPDGSFTEVVDFTLLTNFAEDRVTLNDKTFGSTGSTFSLILDSRISVVSPRNVYRATRSDGSEAETDDVEADGNIIDNAHTRFTFLNFSVNSVVQDSSATSYSFRLESETTLKLEWLVEYALTVRSDFSNTASRARRSDGSLYIEPLESGASGNPSPGVGKQWIERNEPVVLGIDGSVEDLNSYPGLSIRYLPYAYTASGAFADQITASGRFNQVESRQQLPEFSMEGPSSITYLWKLQYGVDLGATNTSAAGLGVVEFVKNFDESTTGQQDAEGKGVHWYDDGTTVRIGSPREVVLGGNPQSLGGWIGGDDSIFSPVEGAFDNEGSSYFTDEQIDQGFEFFTYEGEDYAGIETKLDRPAKVVWDYGEKVILKTITVGEYLRFSADEIEEFGLRTGQEPTVDNGDDANGGNVANAEDFIWDDVAKRYFPVRPLETTLRWPSENGDGAKVILTVLWGVENYKHVAESPPVSLVPRPPEGRANDLVFQEVAYREGDGQVDDENDFTASESGRTVLRFNRVTESGRGGSAQTVVELKVVRSQLWNNNLGATRTVPIGTKITSPLDLAELETGYVFFENARYNPFVYDRTLFEGAALWDADNPPGPVIPVNRNPTASASGNDLFVVVWYDDPSVNDYLLWPHRAERYNPVWPTAAEGLGRIVISSAFGSESVGADGNDQTVIGPITVDGETVPAATTFDPARFEQVQVYNQPSRALPGYNPNEEHALMAPSQRFASTAPRPEAAYTLRENDLNVTGSGSDYTSDPYVLVQFLDRAEDEFKMKVYSVVKEDPENYPDGFSQEMEAGEPVIPYYPLGIVSGASLCTSTYAREGNPDRLTYWTDHKETAWAVSGDGEFDVYFYYPLLPDFWWPEGEKAVGDCVAFLPDSGSDKSRESFIEIDYSKPDQEPDAQGVAYTTVWPLDLPVLKVGETLTFSGGEYAADNSDAPGLPGVLAWAAGEVIYDDLNPDMREGETNPDGKTFENYTARMLSALEERRVPLAVAEFPEALQPAGGRTTVDGTIYRFDELSSSLKKRIFYDPLTGELGIKGFVNDKDIGDDTLTAAPPAVYSLEPNILTEVERDELKGTAEDSPFADLNADGNWTAAVDALFKLSRNPNDLDDDRINEGGGYTAGLQPKDTIDPDTGVVTGEDESLAQSYKALGPGLALVTNPGFLDPLDTDLPDVSYVTLAENNDPSLGGSPVVLHVIKVDRRERYRGAVQVLLSDNVFDENIILRHTGDFGANADDLVFDWWYRVEDGTEAAPPDAIPAGQTSPWQLFPDPSGDGGEGFFQLKLKGNPQAPELLLADSLWFVRYRHKNEEPDDPVTWEADPEIPFEWAGAGNSTPNDLDGDGEPDYQAQLAQGWVKRVLDAVNPYEARIRDFTGDSPATYASMIRQFGQRYEGPVALNPDKDVIENVGLIELYGTVLDRARSLSIDLSTPVSTPGITNALLLASTRLADFYMLLGNEAYSDAQNPAIGFGSDSVEYGSLAPTVFTFQNQLSSPIEEELALLRGVDDFKARPVYNRLFWNFTKGEGEAAYATAYNLSDVNEDGFIDEDDAIILYPQGHGDAWGHYLTALRGQYELLNNPFFNWVSRSELYNLQDIVIEVDFLDERKFAQVAAAKAKAGAEIVELTYRESYVEDPESQWQGYLDTDPRRAWGVEGWARRAGQGAYFDWVTANALIPSEHPNSSFTGIRKVDRTTVDDIAVISANMNDVQRTFEDANDGFNPLGLARNVVPFDVDPGYLEVGGGFRERTHFQQVYDRAVTALNNAVAVFDHANQLNNMLRSLENNEIDFRRSVFEQDMAYRNQLIEIFGSPYDGTIGSGRAYPAGYDGPDTSLYMYVDEQVREISADTVPGMTAGFRNDLNNISSDFGSFISADFRADYAPSFSADNPADWTSNFDGVNYIVTDEEGIDFDSGSARVGLTNMELPIKGSGYTFGAPEDWGQRASPGELQRHIAAMIQQEAELAKAIAAWDGFQGGVIRQLRIIAAQIDLDNNVRDLMVGKIVNKGITGAIIIGLDAASNSFGNAADLAGDLGDAIEGFVPEQLPTAGLSISPGDALSALRGASLTASLGTKTFLQAFGETLSVISATTELTQTLVDEGLDLAIYDSEQNFALKEALVELENMVGDEGILRVEVFRQQEALREMSEEYRALLQKGARLMDEREAYNKRVAELTQRNRYQDMSFRVSRNAALQRYHEAFNLAARYAYLAAKAYDYETNLHPSDAGSAQPFLTEIVRQRGLGQVESGVPQVGKGGLAEQLAKLKANYDVLSTQMGFYFPQTETGRFSLRRELFRIAPDETSDGNWRDVLEDARVDNLWDLPEFRRYARPFAGFDPEQPEPGIVLEFSSEIISRKNFFGRALAGGDNSYDPSVYATKIIGLGAWFEGYLNEGFETGLSETPRIYLIPVGSDVMAYPSDDDLGVRIWDVLDQKIPVPFPVESANLDDDRWRPLDTLGGTQGEIRRFSSFRAYHDSGYFDESQMTFDTRLFGRSVWNTRWLLVIPGATLRADAEAGLETFIDNVTDIKLFFDTYGYSGN